MTPLTFSSHDSTWEILFKLVAAQGGAQVPKAGDSERDLLVKFLQNGGGTGGTGSGVDNDIRNATDLAAVETTDLTVPVNKLFYDEDFDEIQGWQLRAGTDATSAGSVQRPDDYSAGTNEKVWYRVPLA
jgi:hypothetical protein